jgi:hypothetical protein
MFDSSKLRRDSYPRVEVRDGKYPSDMPKIFGITATPPQNTRRSSSERHPVLPQKLTKAMTTLNLENLLTEDDKSFIPYLSRRSVVHSTKGIISSTQPLANEAGYQILAKGGNAADAAVAVAAALNVAGTCIL